MWIIFGYIICESVAGFNRLFRLSLDSRWGIPAVLFVFLFQEYARRMNLSDGGPGNGSAIRVRHRIVSITSCLILISLVLVVLIVWAGVIYKQIVEAE